MPTRPITGPLTRSVTRAITEAGGTGFYVGSLFSSGEQGAWYDPSDFERYMSPKGPERLANFDFTDGAANWMVDNADATHTITFNAGTCRYVSDTTSPILSLKQNGVYATGSWYEVVVVISAWVSGSIKIDASGVTSPAIGAVGTHRFTARATGAGFQLYRNSADVDITIDSISVRELTNISTASLFQDAAGTTPVTAMEQPVGLMLDKRLGLVRGPELVANGGFSVGTGWSFSAGTVAISDGKLRFNAAASGAQAFQEIVQPGRWYEVVFTVDSVSGGSVRVGLNNDSSALSFFQTANPGTFSVKLFNSGGSVPTRFSVVVIGTSVTAVVDNVSVRELPGNHASQATTASKPVLSARKNLLVASEFAGGVIDAPSRGGLVSATAFDGFGGGIAFGHNGTTSSYAYKTFPCSAGVTYTFSVYVEMDDGGIPVVGETSASGDFRLVVEGGGLVGTTATPIGGAIYRISGTLVATGSGSTVGVLKYATQSARTFKVTGYQFEVSPTATRYQRVNTATDYDWVGFPMYLKFDGVDDSLETGNIDFTLTDKMTVWAGVRKLSDAAVGIVVELTTNWNIAGGFFLTAPRADAVPGYQFSIRGTTAGAASTSPNSYAAPHTGILVGAGDLSGVNTAELRINRTIATPSNVATGGGTFANAPLYIGRRAGNSLPFNGHLYGLTVRGAASTQAQIEAGERATATKTGVTL